jgi:N-acetylmuramoyl-L-alanine amidase
MGDVWLRILVIGSIALQGHVAQAARCSTETSEKIRIVLDVGHTAAEPGATSARGVREYDFNLKLARRVQDELLEAGFKSTYLMVTRTRGYPGLYERADRANRMNADIFLSLHHDSVREGYLVPWLYQGEQHFYFDGSKGFSLHVSSYNARYAESVRLARLLADQLMASGLTFTTVHERSNPAGAQAPFIDAARGIYKRDRLVVLGRTHMPAVLLEAGVIINRDDELAVSSSAFQGTIATAIIDSIREFCDPHPAPTYMVIDVAAGSLSIRFGPGADSAVVGTIPPSGRGIRIVGTCAGQWCPIDYRGARGWVNRRYLGGE